MVVVVLFLKAHTEYLHSTGTVRDCDFCPFTACIYSIGIGSQNDI